MKALAMPRAIFGWDRLRAEFPCPREKGVESGFVHLKKGCGGGPPTSPEECNKLRGCARSVICCTSADGLCGLDSGLGVLGAAEGIGGFRG